MIKLIFEDNEQTPSSKLLKSSYNGSNIDFSNGSHISRMISCINKYKDDELIIFFDLSPNNRFTYTNYERLII